MQVAVNDTGSTLGEQRQILGEDLLLQVLGAGRDDHALAAEDGRDEVGEGLAGAGPGFDEQDAAVLERVGDRGGHAALAVARLEGGEGLRQRAVGAEDRVDARRRATSAARDRLARSRRRSRGGGRSGRAGTRRRAPRRRLFTAASAAASAGAARARAKSDAMRSISGSRMPRVVTAGVPTRMPLATIGGFLSNGIAFLLTVIPAWPRAASATLPVRPFENTSTSIR